MAVETPVGRQRRVCVRDESLDEDERALIDVTSANRFRLEREGDPAPGERAAADTPPEMIELLRHGDRALDAVREARAAAPAPGDTDRGEYVRTESGARLRFSRAEDGVRLLAPVPRPNSLRDFMAYEEHVQNTLGEPPQVWYDMPVCYKGNPDSIVGPGDEVPWPAYSGLMDYELELAAVVGRRGTDIDAAEADSYIAGYTILNDFSARDTQGEEMDANLGPAKGKDFANALGPYLVTADAFEPSEATMTAAVNGDTWSEGTPGEMHHSFADSVAHVADGEHVYPGDVLGSGTVGEGCGLELSQFLEAGDTVALDIEGIGRLENTITRADDTDDAGED